MKHDPPEKSGKDSTNVNRALVPSANRGASMFGLSLFLLALGAILYFAVTATVSGVSLSTVGVILMVIGAVGFLASLFLNRWPWP